MCIYIYRERLYTLVTVKETKQHTERGKTMKWYACMRDNNDNDWGVGSYDLEEATATVKDWRENGLEEAYIAVIEEGNDPVCVEEIREF